MDQENKQSHNLHDAWENNLKKNTKTTNLGEQKTESTTM